MQNRPFSDNRRSQPCATTPHWYPSGKTVREEVIMRGGLHSLRQGCIALMALAIAGCLTGSAVRAEEAPPAPSAPSAAAPSTQRSGAGSERASTPPASPATAEQHKLPP